MMINEKRRKMSLSFCFHSFLLVLLTLINIRLRSFQSSLSSKVHIREEMQECCPGGMPLTADDRKGLGIRRVRAGGLLAAPLEKTPAARSAAQRTRMDKRRQRRTEGLFYSAFLE